MPKTFFTYEQQLNKLQYEKQLTITNPAYAEEVLEKLSYYSLIGGYKNLFKHPASGNYIYGVTFEEIVAFYYFDEELRTLSAIYSQNRDFPCGVRPLSSQYSSYILYTSLRFIFSPTL